MAQSSYDIVLIHGSWLDGQAWSSVAERLRSQGHRVHTPTLEGHGAVAGRDFTHEETWRAVVAFIEDQDVRDFILVGHSFGGTIVSKVAEAIPERIRRLVYWNAFVLRDGECLVDHTPPDMRAAMLALMEASADKSFILPYALFRDAFLNDADTSLARKIYDGLYPEHAPLFLEKLSFPTFFSLNIPKSFLYAWDDDALPHGAWGWYPKFASRLGPHRLVTMPGGHMALLTNPMMLADKIIEAGRD